MIDFFLYINMLLLLKYILHDWKYKLQKIDIAKMHSTSVR